MSELKNSWKKTGSEMGSAFSDLGKSIVKSVRKGVDKATEWAEGDEPAEEKPQPEIVEEAAPAEGEDK